MRTALALAASLAALSTGAEATPRVLATVGMIGDVAATLAGDCAEVETLVGPGSDPHLYRATPEDVRNLDRADLILYLGLGLEGKLADVLARFATRKPVLGVGAVFAPDVLLTEGGATDPHVWMAPALWAQTVAPIATALRDLAPGCGAAIDANAARLTTELAALDAWAAASLAALPPDRRVLVTAHDAFGYFGRAYDLRLVAIQGISTESEPSVADIAQTADAVVAAGVPAVFVETTINPRTIEAMLSAVAARGQVVTIGGELYADAMGDAGTVTGTYIGMIHANVHRIVTALGATPAPLPEGLAVWAARWGLE